MSRTKRIDRFTNKTVPDGKHAWRCRCSWCMSVVKKRLITKWAWKDDAQYQIDSSSDAMEFYHPEKQEYLDRHFGHDYGEGIDDATFHKYLKHD